MAPRRVSDFDTMFRRGLGRAVLYLRENAPQQAHRDLILKGCTHSLAYDQQCEDARSHYLFDAITATGEAAYYADALGSLLPHPLEPEEDEDWEQALQVAALLATSGHGRLRPLLYETFARNIAEGCFIGAEALVRMDGVVGLDFVAEQTRKYPLDDEDTWQEDALLCTFEEIVGGPAARREALAPVRRRSPALAALLSRIQAGRNARDAAWERRPPRTRPPRDYPEWRTWLADPDTAPFRISRITWRRWGRDMNAEMAVRLAEDLIAEQDADRLLRTLYVFADRRFPLSFERLIDLTQEDKASPTFFAACRALANIADPAVRQAGLALILRGEWRMGASLLVQNPSEGDAELLQRLIEYADQSDEDRHGMGMAIRDYYKTNRNAPDAAGPLLALYEQGPCSLCRNHVVDLLLERDALSDELRAECRHDSYLATREAVRL